MKNLLLPVLLCIALAGCDMLGGKENAGNKPEGNKPETEAKKPAESKFNVGDTVVARWAQNSFYEGKIEKIDGNKLTVKWSDGSSPSEIDRTDAFPLPKAGDKPDVKAGDMVLAKINTGTYWNGAEISSIDGEVYKVKTVGDASANLPAEKIIKVPPAIAADLKEKAGATDFMKEAQAKKPSPPAGYKPKSGEKVLAEWATYSWWQGKVEKVSGDKATIAWEDGSKPSEIDLSKILPVPTANDAKLPEKDQFVLVKPESGTKWQYGQTVSAEDGKAEVKFSDGKTRTVKAGEFILLN